MNRRQMIVGTAAATAALPLRGLADDNREQQIIEEFKTIIERYKLSVPTHTDSNLLARYLYKNMVLFAQFSEMRDRT